MVYWLVISAILITLWEVIIHVIPEGWILAPFNVLFFLASFAIGAFGYLPTIQKKTSRPVAWLVAVILWFVVFVLLRSLLFPAK